jgi:hypothetical protein
MTRRIEELLNISYGAQLKALAPIPMFVDVTHGVQRRPWSENLRCMSCSSDVYDTRRDRMISCSERLALQGLPAKYMTEHWSKGPMSDFKERDLLRGTGQAFFGPAIGSIIMAVWLLEGPWWEPAPERPTKRGRHDNGIQLTNCSPMFQSLLSGFLGIGRG